MESFQITIVLSFLKLHVEQVYPQEKVEPSKT